MELEGIEELWGKVKGSLASFNPRELFEQDYGMKESPEDCLECFLSKQNITPEHSFCYYIPSLIKVIPNFRKKTFTK